RLAGDVVSADEHCSCRTRVDISFSIDAFLAHHAPAAAPGVVATDDHGWYRLADGDIEFRLPRAADHLAIARVGNAEAAIVARCIRPHPPTHAQREHVEIAMELMAPSLCSEVEGTCPECGATVAAVFDPVHYTLRELR